MVIAPSILAGDFSKFARELKRVEKAEQIGFISM